MSYCSSIDSLFQSVARQLQFAFCCSSNCCQSIFYSLHSIYLFFPFLKKWIKLLLFYSFFLSWIKILLLRYVRGFLILGDDVVALRRNIDSLANIWIFVVLGVEILGVLEQNRVQVDVVAYCIFIGQLCVFGELLGCVCESIFVCFIKYFFNNVIINFTYPDLHKKSWIR